MNGAVWEEVEPVLMHFFFFLPFTYLVEKKSASFKDEKWPKLSLFIFVTAQTSSISSRQAETEAPMSQQPQVRKDPKLREGASIRPPSPD